MPDTPQYQYIKLPDGSLGKFDAAASDADIKAAISKDFPQAYAPPATPPNVAQRAWRAVNDPTHIAKALGVPAEEERLRQRRDANISAGNPIRAAIDEFQRANIDPGTGITHLLTPLTLATAAAAPLLSKAGSLGRVVSASMGAVFGYQGAKAAISPQQPGESETDLWARRVKGGAQGLLGGLYAGEYLGGEARTAVRPEQQPPSVPMLKPGAPPQGPAPAAQVPRTIDVQATPVSEAVPVESPTVKTARLKTEAMRGRAARGEISQDDFQTWFRTGKEPGTSAPPNPPTPAVERSSEERAFQEENYKALSRKVDQRGVPMGGTEEFLAGPPIAAPKVGPPPVSEEDLPRPLGQTIRAKLPNPERMTSSGFVIPIPSERTTGIHDEAIKAGGAIPGGLQPAVPEVGLPEYAYFHDPESGSSLMLPTEPPITAEGVKEQLAKSRAQYAEARARAEAPKPP